MKERFCNPTTFLPLSVKNLSGIETTELQSVVQFAVAVS
jgi:hypothetical protein